MSECHLIYGPRGAPIADRLKSKVIIDAETGCWVWQATLENGAGCMTSRPEITLRMTPVAFSPKMFEQAFGIGHTKLYEEIAAGRLVARKIGKRTVILAQDAMAWAEALPRVSTMGRKMG